MGTIMPTSVPMTMPSARTISVDNGEHSDEQLIRSIAAGDRRAMEMLYGRHHVRVYRFALRLLKNEANAEDVTSEAFLEVWKQAGRFEARSQVSIWLLA